MKTKISSPARTKSAFTLVEILVVLVIIGIIAAFAAPAMNAVLKSSKMTTAADQIMRDLNLARQTAIKDNAPVEFRFYNISDPDQPGNEKAYRSYQAIRKVYDREDPLKFEVESVTEVRDLPDATIITDEQTFSSMISHPGVTKGIVEKAPGESKKVIGANYVSFLFMTDGSTNLKNKGASELWFFTFVRETDDITGDEPPSFATIQVDPFTGKTRRYEK